MIAPLNQSSLPLQTDLHALPQLLQWFEQFNIPPLSEDLWVKCQLALTEGFTNAVRHAHRDLPETTPIDIEVRVFPDCLEMRIWDWGQPFDLQAKLNFILEHPPGTGAEGGRGLLWMYQLSDELFYIRQQDRRNCLVMRKRIN